MIAYYNEVDPAAAAALRALIADKFIAPGDVDERSIEDVSPADILGYTQCHFFAGQGVWSYALRLAGWPDDRPVWTGSCPCQPFSAAGKGKGFADERHLWPAFHWLIQQCRPDIVFGEQVAGKDGLGWLDLVSTDLEALDYACGAVPFPAAGIGAPHIRERLYWMAHAEGDRRANGAAHIRGSRQVSTTTAEIVGTGNCRSLDRVADDQLQQRQVATGLGYDPRGWQQEPAAASGLRRNSWPGPTNGVWRDADWLGCRDGKWRPVEPGAQPLAHGIVARVGQLRLHGNAIVAPQAAAFIESYIEVMGASE